jgi:hypothetical protein
MLCSTVREELHTLSDGERLPMAQRLVIWRHCLRCADCRTSRRQFRRLCQTTRRLHNTWLISPALYHRIMTELLVLRSETILTRQANAFVYNRAAREKQMKKRLALAVTAFVLPIVSGTLFAQILSGRFDVQKEPPQDSQIKRVETDGDRRNAAYVKRAQKLRTQWKRWAMAHRQDLSLMLQDNAEGRAAFKRILRLLPAVCNSSRNAVLSPADLNNEYVPFTYTAEAINQRKHLSRMTAALAQQMKLLQKHLAEKQVNSTAEKAIKEQMQQIGERLAQMQLDEMEQVALIEMYMVRDHDIPIVRSANMRYTLWVSGRITESVPPKVFAVGGEFRTVKPAARRDIAPPYEELTK